MTERFIVDDDGIVTDMLDLSMYIDEEDCCEKLNELHEENKELKAKVDDKEVAVEVECEKLMQKVFEVFDKRINALENDYTKAVKEGMPSNCIYGKIKLLRELKGDVE